MNFLNKKYTSMHGNSPFGHSQSNSRSFLPSSSTVRDSPAPISSNNCEVHPSEVVRHMCLECVELLCAQCIGEHLQLHREANHIPKIVSLRQLKGDMESKIDHITHMMTSQNPNSLQLEALRKHVTDKVDNMRKDLIRAIDDWVTILRNHLLTTLGFEEVAKTKVEMERLRDEICLLQQSLSTNGQSSIIKKIFQIDGEKLKEGYNSMFSKFKELSFRADFDIIVNWKDIIKNIQSNIVIKTKSEEQEIIEEDQEELEQESRPESVIPSDGESREDVI